MAAQGDRPDLNGPTRPLRALGDPPEPAAERAPWFGVTGIVLLATVLATLFVESRQMALLEQATRQDDYVVLNLYQAEIEYLRLREQWGLALAERDDARAALPLRYEIFVSRVGLLRTERARAALSNPDGYAAALSALDDFVQRADAVVARGATDAAGLRALYASLRELDEPIHQLLLGAAHRVAEQQTERHASIRQHNRASLALVASLLALVLVFGFIALRRLRQLQQSRHAAEALAARLDEARADALRASQAKSEFMSNMSHEIRTPFHGLLGMLALLHETPLDARQQGYLASADESARHLLALLNDILDLSKLEAGTLTLLPQALDVAALLRGVEHSMRSQAAAKGIALRSEVDPDVPKALLMDGTRVRQILLNLIVNAIRFTDAGSVSVRCTCARASAPGEVVFSVVDTGIGFDAAALEGLFERFGRIDASRSRRQQGSGLGLEIARKLARLMGGDVTATSTPGQGSTFTLRLPLRLPNDAPGGALPAASAAQDAAGSAATPRRALAVLVAEDHPVNTQYMAALLERLGHRATFVADGWQAVQAAKERRFDIVLMDVHMPQMDGIAAASTIRAFEEPGAAQVPIIGLTADDLTDTRERCIDAGMQEVLHKPLGLNELKALLIRHFGSAAGVADGGEPPSGPADAAPLLDRALVARLFELMPRGDSAALYDALLAQAREASRRMHGALRAADAPTLRHASHGIKGAALNLGLRALADAADHITQLAEGLNATQLALALQRFDETLAATHDLCVSLAMTEVDRPSPGER